MELEFDVKITSGALYDYMLYHTYTSLSGIMGTMVGAFILIAFFNTGYTLYLIAGVVLLLHLPCSLYLKAKAQALNTPAFKNPLHYRLTEEGIEVSQGEEAQMQVWEDLYKAVSTRSSIIVYTSKVSASIFPRKDLKELTPAVIEKISTHMPPDKVKIRG